MPASTTASFAPILDQSVILRQCYLALRDDLPFPTISPTPVNHDGSPAASIVVISSDDDNDTPHNTSSPTNPQVIQISSSEDDDHNDKQPKQSPYRGTRRLTRCVTPISPTTLASLSPSPSPSPSALSPASRRQAVLSKILRAADRATKARQYKLATKLYLRYLNIDSSNQTVRARFIALTSRKRPQPSSSTVTPTHTRTLRPRQQHHTARVAQRNTPSCAPPDSSRTTDPAAAVATTTTTTSTMTTTTTRRQLRRVASSTVSPNAPPKPSISKPVAKPVAKPVSSHVAARRTANSSRRAQSSARLRTQASSSRRGTQDVIVLD